MDRISRRRWWRREKVEYLAAVKDRACVGERRCGREESLGANAWRGDSAIIVGSEGGREPRGVAGFDLFGPRKRLWYYVVGKL